MPTERQRASLAFRREGATYAEIGRRLGIGPAAARILVDKAIAWERHEAADKRTVASLSSRARNVLIRVGVSSGMSKADVARCLKDVDLQKVKNCGISTINEIKSWLSSP